MNIPPPDAPVPAHVAIIMDGNGRWAQQRSKARNEGHEAGVGAARTAVRRCSDRGVGHLTLFAFSSENWFRPTAEVDHLLGLLLRALAAELPELDREAVRVRCIGDRADFPAELREIMATAEQRTRANRGLTLTIAAGYGGQWDLVQAARALAHAVAAGELAAGEIDAARLAAALPTAALPAVDLLIRTGGEQRLSNFLPWQLAYAELYFTETLWPAFDAAALEAALDWYARRARRFGRVTAGAGHAPRAD